MTPVLPAPELLPPVSVDRVRLIRRSMRCFAFGLMGAVPLFGLGPACLALRLQQQLAEETGETPPLAGAEMVALAVVAFMLAVVLLCYGQAGMVLGMGILLSALQGYGWFRQYQRAEPRLWNPARHLVFWAAALAWAGLILSSTIIMLSLGSFIQMIGR
jgi:hypothetical protein